MQFYANNRREFLKQSMALAVVGSMATAGHAFEEEKKAPPLFKISLAQWSLHRAFRADKIDNLDFAKVAKEDFDIDAIEYVNQFFKDKANDKDYLRQLKKRAEDLDVKALLIMVDGEGELGDSDEKKRKQTIENHYKWIEVAKFLGCHSIRVNARSSGTYNEQRDRAADGLRRLSEFAAKHEINVLVENHGGLSSDGQWLAKVIAKVKLENCGTLPDFGNFRVSRDKTYDRYDGVTELMPFAKAVSAKSHDFDDDGNETQTDYTKMLKIVVDAGYQDYIGIEYEGGRLDEYAGIRATKKLMERVRKELSLEAVSK